MTDVDRVKTQAELDAEAEARVATQTYHAGATGPIMNYTDWTLEDESLIEGEDAFRAYWGARADQLMDRAVLDARIAEVTEYLEANPPPPPPPEGDTTGAREGESENQRLARLAAERKFQQQAQREAAAAARGRKKERE